MTKKCKLCGKPFNNSNYKEYDVKISFNINNYVKEGD